MFYGEISPVQAVPRRRLYRNRRRVQPMRMAQIAPALSVCDGCCGEGLSCGYCDVGLGKFKFKKAFKKIAQAPKKVFKVASKVYTAPIKAVGKIAKKVPKVLKPIAKGTSKVLKQAGKVAVKAQLLPLTIPTKLAKGFTKVASGVLKKSVSGRWTAESPEEVPAEEVAPESAIAPQEIVEPEVVQPEDVPSTVYEQPSYDYSQEQPQPSGGGGVWGSMFSPAEPEEYGEEPSSEEYPTDEEEAEILPDVEPIPSFPETNTEEVVETMPPVSYEPEIAPWNVTPYGSELYDVDETEGLSPYEIPPETVGLALGAFVAPELGLLPGLTAILPFATKVIKKNIGGVKRLIAKKSGYQTSTPAPAPVATKTAAVKAVAQKAVAKVQQARPRDFLLPALAVGGGVLLISMLSRRGSERVTVIK